MNQPRLFAELVDMNSDPVRDAVRLDDNRAVAARDPARAA